jgi:hypothetical protein
MTRVEPGFLVHPQVPELVLQDDGHLLRILRAQPRRDDHAGVVGPEGDIEMMLAGQAVDRGMGDRPRNHLAERLLGPFVVRQQAVGPLRPVILHRWSSMVGR